MSLASPTRATPYRAARIPWALLNAMRCEEPIVCESLRTQGARTFSCILEDLQKYFFGAGWNLKAEKSPTTSDRYTR